MELLASMILSFYPQHLFKAENTSEIPLIVLKNQSSKGDLKEYFFASH